MPRNGKSVYKANYAVYERIGFLLFFHKKIIVKGEREKEEGVR